MSYGEYTKVPFDRSINEIVTMLRKRGAGQIFQGEDGDMFAIQFSLADRMIRFRVCLSEKPGKPPGELRRKQRARALLLVIKAKLESVDSEIETIEEAFLANIVLPDGKTVIEEIKPSIAIAYETGKPGIVGLLSDYSK